jgi:hypothetical protein
LQLKNKNEKKQLHIHRFVPAIAPIGSAGCMLWIGMDCTFALYRDSQ